MSPPGPAEAASLVRAWMSGGSATEFHVREVVLKTSTVANGTPLLFSPPMA